ncbi:MAG: pyridoxamine 5'-phosphate oxidase family protein [Myxococcales bacterium]|nr:pyridoxamine 5'-phosphate oxidase family protein [Myxococcales bacterium]
MTTIQREDQGASAREELREVVSSFDTAMLVTELDGFGLRARPMALAAGGMAEHEAGNDDLYFATRIDSGKTREVRDDSHVVVTFQSKTKFASLSGLAQVVGDPKLVERLWSDAWQTWFPQGAGDPTLCIIRVSPTEGEYWDMGAARGLRYLFDAAKAYATGEPAGGDVKNQRVRL